MLRSVTRAFAPLAALALLAAPALAADYHVTSRWTLGGEGGWDYLTVDSPGQRLFVSRSTRVQVVSLENGKVIGEIPGTPGVHGIALVPEFGHGYTSNGRDSSVTEFDLKSLATVKRIPIGARNPDAIIYDAATKRIFTFNGGSNSATAIDAATDSVIGAVALGGKPEEGASDGRGRIFVNLEDSSAVVAFDARTLQVKVRWTLAPGEEPTGIAIDREHYRLFSVCSNQHMIVTDTESGKVVGDVPIGTRVDGAGFDPATGLAFSSNGEGSVTVVFREKSGSFKVVATVPTERGARTMALDLKTHRLYLPTASYGDAPAATAENPRPRPTMVPDSFRILVLDR